MGGKAAAPSLHERLVFVVDQELGVLRRRREAGFRRQVQAMLDPRRASGIEQLLSRRFDAALRAGDILTEARKDELLPPWVPVPIVALAFQAVANATELYWAATEMGLEGKERDEAIARTRRMLDRAVWAYRVMLGLR